ncbi:hypothetical protein JZ751_018412, partial [Albula glossodonta]
MGLRGIRSCLGVGRWSNGVVEGRGSCTGSVQSLASLDPRDSPKPPVHPDLPPKLVTRRTGRPDTSSSNGYQRPGSVSGHMVPADITLCDSTRFSAWWRIASCAFCSCPKAKEQGVLIQGTYQQRQIRPPLSIVFTCVAVSICLCALPAGPGRTRIPLNAVQDGGGGLCRPPDAGLRPGLSQASLGARRSHLERSRVF